MCRFIWFSFVVKTFPGTTRHNHIRGRLALLADLLYSVAKFAIMVAVTALRPRSEFDRQHLNGTRDATASERNPTRSPEPSVGLQLRGRPDAIIRQMRLDAARASKKQTTISFLSSCRPTRITHNTILCTARTLTRPNPPSRGYK